MQIKRHAGPGLVAVTLGLAALATGCGGSSTTATPLGTSTTVRTPTTLSTPASGSTSKSAPTTTAKGSTVTTAPPGAKPSTAALAGLQQALDQAGSSLAAGGNAIAGADVNQAKTQEGSAP